MTVNICYGNEEHSVMLTDVMASDIERQSNSFVKSKDFSKKQYHGSICGAGTGNTLLGVFRNLNDMLADNADDFIDNVRSKISDTETNLLENILSNERKIIETEISALYSPSRETCEKMIKQVSEAMGSDLRKQISENGLDMSKVPPELMKQLKEMELNLFNYIASQQFDKQMQKYNQILDEKLMRTSNEMREYYKKVKSAVLIDFYDKKQKKLRRFYVDASEKAEVELPYITNGIGKDGADFYLLQKTQGIDPDDISLGEILFHTGMAYAASTINRGVGGTPNITITDKHCAKVLAKEHNAAITNICGAANAGMLEKKKAVIMINNVIGTEPQYEEIARVLEMTERDLTMAARNPNEWIEIANSDTKSAVPEKRFFSDNELASK